MLDAKQIKDKFSTASNRKINFEILYRLTQEYTIPDKENFIHHTEGAKKDDTTNKIFDSTPLRALDKFVSNMHASMVPPGKKWANLAVGTDVPDADKDRVGRQLEEIREKLFSRLSNSNFDTQISECFYDLALGSAAILVQEGKSIHKPFNFVSIPIEQVYWDEGVNGVIDTIFRKHKIKGRNVEATWEGIILPDLLAEKIKRQPNEDFEFIECTYPAVIDVVKHSVVKNGLGQENLQALKEHVNGFKYSVICPDGEDILYTKDLRSNPWITFRWSVVAGEIWGRGPAVRALADIRSLNKTKELILKNANVAISGIFTFVDDGITDPRFFKMTPGSFNPVGSNGGNTMGPSIAPLQTGTKFDVGQMIIKDLQASINDMLFSEPLGPIDSPVKTATELSLRQQEMSKRIGSAFGRLQHELLIPLINRLIFILNEWGIINLDKDLKVDGGILKIEYISPLALAQEREELNSIVEYVQTIASLYGPEVAMAMAPVDKVAQKIAELLNVPKSILPTSEEVTAMKQTAAQQAQVAQQSQQNALKQGKEVDF